MPWLSDDDWVEDDVRAIHRYLQEQPPVTEEGDNIRSAALRWFDDLGYTDWDDDDTLNQARTYRNQFDLANAESSQEKKMIQDHWRRGQTSEESRGETRPVIDYKTGKVGQDKGSWGWVIGLAAVGALGLGAMPIIPIRWKILAVEASVASLGVSAAVSLQRAARYVQDSFGLNKA